VSCSFGGLHVLKNVSLVVEQGTITGLIGPNGAGKSTLFNIISGFLSASAGEVRYKGQDIGRLPVHARSSVGLVRSFQTPQVFAHMSVLENLMAGCHRQGRSGVVSGLMGLPRARAEVAHMRQRAEATCDRFGLQGIRDRLAGSLPAGQQRLVELARACIGAPQLLCLDEPSSGLNSEEVVQLMRVLAQLNREGLSILLVSHDMNLVTIAEVIHVLCFGEIICTGSVQQVQSDARVREAYLGA